MRQKKNQSLRDVIVDMENDVHHVRNLSKALYCMGERRDIIEPQAVLGIARAFEEVCEAIWEQWQEAFNLSGSQGNAE